LADHIGAHYSGKLPLSVFLRDNEHIVLHGIHGAAIHGSMDTAIYLLKSLPFGEHFHLATSILYEHRATFYDIVDMPRMIVPVTHLPGGVMKCRAVTVAGPSKSSE